MNEPRTSPFVRYPNGSVVYPPNTIHECLRELLRLSPSTVDLSVFDGLIRHELIGGQDAVAGDTTWYAFLRDLLTLPSQVFSRSEDLTQLIVESLRIIAAGPYSTSWPLLENFILTNIDEFSGWTHCWLKDHAEMRNVIRGDDNNYYYRDQDGILVQVIGGKTSTETRLDYIGDAVLRPFGCLRKLLNAVSVFSISEDYTSNPGEYPSNLCLRISEPEFGMLSPRWEFSYAFKPRSPKWRPRAVECDPEWLADQVVAKAIGTAGWDVRAQHFNRFVPTNDRPDINYPLQLDYLLDTGLVIDGEDEVEIEFEGRKFRWIGGTGASRPILSVGVKDNSDFSTAEDITNKLLSYLAWEYNVPIRKMHGIGGPRRNLPLTWGPWRALGLGVGSSGLLSSYRPGTQVRSQALAFYREGLNSDSVFYKFFNLWKIIELAHADRSDRYNWIRTNALKVQLAQARVTEIASKNPDIAEYLDNSGRNAIAHVFRPPTVNPDDPGDRQRISKDLGILEELVRIAMHELN